MAAPPRCRVARLARAVAGAPTRRAPRRRLATHAWGNADHGQLGLPHALLHAEPHTFGRTVPLPRVVPALRNYALRAAAASAAHSAFVRADGTLFTCGYAADGQLAHPDARPRMQPTPVPALPAIASVACGARHTLALADDGRVFAFGANNLGQLGVAHLPDPPSRSAAPLPVQRLLDAGHRIVAVAAGHDFSLALSDDGRVFSWGSAASGRLGHPDPAAARRPSVVAFVLGAAPRPEPGPRLVRALDGVRVARICAGSHHAVAVDAAGAAYAWGAGRHFLLGTGDQRDRPEPVEALPGLRVRKVAPGAMHALVLTHAGAVFALGHNEHGCLGLGYHVVHRTVPEPVPVPALARVSDVAAGWHLSAAVRPEGVAMWGCGAAGALGNGDVVDHWAPVDIRLRANNVVIGSAGTSVLAYG